jgi:hypothetical protein
MDVCGEVHLNNNDRRKTVMGKIGVIVLEDLDLIPDWGTQTSSHAIPSQSSSKLAKNFEEQSCSYAK